MYTYEGALFAVRCLSGFDCFMILLASCSLQDLWGGLVVVCCVFAFDCFMIFRFLLLCRPWGGLVVVAVYYLIVLNCYAVHDSCSLQDLGASMLFTTPAPLKRQTCALRVKLSKILDKQELHPSCARSVIKMKNTFVS